MTTPHPGPPPGGDPTTTPTPGTTTPATSARRDGDAPGGVLNGQRASWTGDTLVAGSGKGSAVGSPFDVPAVDTSRPNIARVYDYWLGGKDHFAADRQLAEQVKAALPGIVDHVRANRAFLGRAVRELARDGVDQFLDLGAGIPTSPNVHQVVHKVNPAARVVYVDNDPVVLANARALLAVDRLVRVADGDVRDPSAVLAHPVVTAHVDRSRPVAVVLAAVLHFLTDQQAAALLAAVAAYLREGAGGFVVVSQVTPVDGQTSTSDGQNLMAEGMGEAVAAYRASAGPFFPRAPAQVAELLTGWVYQAPGLVPVDAWRPDRPRRATDPIPVVGVVASPPATAEGAAIAQREKRGARGSRARQQARRGTRLEAPRTASGTARGGRGWQDLAWPRAAALVPGRTVICRQLLGSGVDVYTAPVGRRRRERWSQEWEVSRRR